MRIVVVTLFALAGLTGYLLLTGQLTTFAERLAGEPQELELDLTALHPEMDRDRFLQGLSPERFFCTDDTREHGTELGERACFTSVHRVSGLETEYLALFFDEDDRLAAMNIVLREDAHAGNLDYLRETLGEVSHQVEDDGVWLAWGQFEGVLLTREELPDDEERPTLMWFRDSDLMERLLP